MFTMLKRKLNGVLLKPYNKLFVTRTFFRLNNTYCSKSELSFVPIRVNNCVGDDSNSSTAASANLIAELNSNMLRVLDTGNDELLYDLLGHINDKHDSFTGEDFLRLFIVLRECLKLNNRLRLADPVVDFLNAMDTACYNRYHSFDKEMRLKLALILGDIQTNIKFQFFYKVVRHLCSKFNKLQNSYCLDCLQLLHLYKWYRSKYVNLYLIEEKLNSCFDEFNEQQVVSFLILFTKRNDYVFINVDLVKKLINFLPVASDSNTVIYLLDVLASNWTSINEKLLLEIRGFVNENNKNYNHDINFFIRVAHLYRKLNYYDKDILNYLALAYKQNIQTINIAQIEHVIELLTYWNVMLDDYEIYRETLNEIRSEHRVVDGSAHTKRLLQIVAHISSINVYDYDILNQALSVEYLRAVYKNRRITRCSIPWYILMLNANVRLDCPDYDGSKLEDDLTESWAKVKQEYFSTVTLSNSLSKLYVATLLDVKSYLDRLFDKTIETEHYTRVCYTLPHLMLPDLVFALNCDKIPQTLIFDSDVNWILRPLKCNTRCYYAITLVNGYDDGHDFLAGCNITKKRQLPKLGYKMILLYTRSWHTLDDSQKLQLVKNKIDQIE